MTSLNPFLLVRASPAGGDAREEDFGHCEAFDLVPDHIDPSVIGRVELEDMLPEWRTV